MKVEELNKQGQSLFELIVAIAITSIALIAIISLVTSSITNSTFSRDRTLASRYTQEASEWLRSRRDRDWGDFTSMASPSGSTYCISSLPEYPGLPPAGNCGGVKIPGTKFSRELNLTHNPSIDPNTVNAEIVTSWLDSTGQHESRVSTSLTNWRTK